MIRARSSPDVANQSRGWDQVAEHLGHRFHQDHDQDEELLRALIDRLVVRVGEIELDDLGAHEQLHDDGRRDYRADAEVHQRTLSPGENGAIGSEDVYGPALVQAVDEDVCHHEVEDQDDNDP